MSTGIIGKKLGMTSVYDADGKNVPVTVVQAGPCVVTQIKTDAVDGYTALQLAFDEKKEKRVTKPLQGHFAKSGDKCYAKVKEFRLDDAAGFELGQAVTVDMFEVGEKVDVTGTSKGRGFSGTVKRHGFQRGPETHGSRNHRAPGSIGCSAYPARVMKGKRLPGQYGGDRKTVQNLEVVAVRPEDHVILVKGAVPGANKGYVEIKKKKKS
ncbi:MAG: 50S ribosomal protein L3 [Deltaproteobacteria bacterium]|nr:MAG: 50S ribosomal protein L3 [Deltaproteobacteria bacterium]